MLRNLRIGLRFQAAVMVTIAAVIATIQVASYSTFKTTLQEAEKRELTEIHEAVMTELASEGRTAQAMSQLVAGIPLVQQAFAQGDRDRLKVLFLPGFDTLKRDFGARQFQFHLPPATSFLRVHKPQKHSDDLSGIRHTVVETNSSRAPVAGLEMGVAGLGIRGIVPVADQGRHIGSVEFGMSFDQSFFENFSAKHEVKLALSLLKDGVLQPFAGTLDNSGLIDPEQQRAALEGVPQLFQTHDGDTPVSVYSKNVSDYSGKTIGVLTIASDRSYYAQQTSNLVWTILLLGLAGMAVASVLTWLIARSVTVPLLTTVRSMEAIAQGGGDLSQRLDDGGKDEIAALARAFNSFADTLQNIVSKVSVTSGRLGSTISQLAEQADRTHRSMQQQQSETTLVATAMTEMSSTVQEVARNTADTATSASEAEQCSLQGKQVVETTISDIQRLAGDVGQAVEVVQQVNEDTNRIGGVLDVIGSIAEQTNLLALNAAIEAARAGEQGRGFAVVADEVRTLASRTQEATSEIQEMIESLQSGVKKTVAAMQNSAEIAGQTVEQAGTAGASLTQISDSVQRIDQMSLQIATASEQQSQVAEDISRNLNKISQLADTTLHSAENTNAQAVTLAQDIETLIAEVGRLSNGNDIHGQLERAKTSHLAWTTKVRQFLDGKGTLDEKIAFSEHHCAFGQWFDQAYQEHAHMPEMEQIKGPHARLHRTIKSIAELKRNGDLDAAESEYLRIAPLSEEIVGLISRLQEKL